ncbi:MAG: hypothetical protein RLZ56_1040 [Bacteroidota bacterium]
MKRSIVLLLVSLYLLGATEAYQLLKLPYLISHYQTHQQLDKGLGFSKFIKMHYIDVQTYDNDYQQDMQLPFKSSNRTISLLNFVTLFAPKQIVASPVFYEPRKMFLLFDDAKHYSLNYGNIFQPPRV